MNRTQACLSGGLFFAGALSVALSGCSEGAGRAEVFPASSCMTCHNGSQHSDYAGPGTEDPHPFGDTAGMDCTVCHGGDPDGVDKTTSHVPAPPEIGDREQWLTDREAYFNRLTLVGIDRYPDYVVDGVTHTALEWLQFVNPGDLRVVETAKGCGQCHAPHAESVSHSLLATSAGVFSGATYTIGAANRVPENQGLHLDTAADLAWRAESDADGQPDAGVMGSVGRLLQFPVFSQRVETPVQMFKNDEFLALALADDVEPDNRVVTDSPLSSLFHEQVAFTCGDCHLGSAGANNRAGDFRGSGCSACHMPKSLGGRSGSRDPNVPKDEPYDPDDIDEPELPHLRAHRILSISKTLPDGEFLPGIDDYACAGCHQGSNRTVMQYWGIRLDQNQDLRNDFQYPANPVEYDDTSGDERLFDPEVGNDTFNGRNRRQYIRFEDYDGDGRDDTPEDVHYEAGLGCIDCHGSHDLHGGQVSASGDALLSRMEQAVAIRCESCHGDADGYAPTAPGTHYDGWTAQLAMDAEGNPLRHVWRDANGDTWLKSRLTGQLHFVSQTRDVVVDSGRVHPLSGEEIYTPIGSYAMGRADGDAATGLGPLQTADLDAPTGFTHGENMSCASCHASWTNNCIGCHLEGEYDTGNNFSNITGERIVFRERNADFVYQSPVMFQLGVAADNRIAPIAPNTDAFFKFLDRNDEWSQVFAFTDRNGGGNDPADAAAPSLSHNVMMPHSIRGKVTETNEGPRYCVACHLTQNAVDTHGPAYDAFRLAYTQGDYGALPFTLLQEHIGRNPGNQLDSPFFVHMAAGLGSGLFLFDENGCPVNPLDTNPDRKGCEGQAPAPNFDPARVALDLDRIVDENGIATGSSAHPMAAPGTGANLREGAQEVGLSGPLGAPLVQRLTDPATGIVLDSWVDADGVPHGGAPAVLGEEP